FHWTADIRYADYSERMLINSVLEAFDSNAMVTYFTPMTTGFTKFFGGEEAFWCCSGTGVESLARLQDEIYSWDENSLYVNMFIASRLNWKEKKVSIEQTTGFPAEQDSKLTIHVDSPTQFSLKIRIPYWATQGATWKINGKEESRAQPSASSYYLNIERKWNNGDVVELSFPMSLHSEPLKYAANIRAFLYGPIVLVGMVQRDQFANRDPNVPIDPCGSPLNDWYLLADANHPELWLEKEKDRSLTFKTYGINRSLTFKPLYEVEKEPYGIYWLMLKKDSNEYRALLNEITLQSQREKQRVIDRVFIGDSNSENAHAFQGESHVAYQAGRPGREGKWSYTLKTLPDAPMTLLCTYPTGDHYARHGDIIVDGSAIATLLVPINPPTEFVNTEFAIPESLTKGKDQVTVEFRPRKDCSIDPIFGLAIMKPADYILTTDINKSVKIGETRKDSSEKGKSHEVQDDFGLSPQRVGAPQK
ncbi:MAG: beta-L-arabinofuranosidase domain-containing protein, partial [Phycisphaerales bacterium]